jgi:tetraacyldisaccharide 4'-kinase
VAAQRLAETLQRHWWRPRPSWLARALQPVAWLYRAVAALHRAASRPAAPLPVPVVVVGNLIVGGAGKTPTVIALVLALRGRGWTPGVISRGYRRRDDALREVDDTTPAADVGDEPLLIHRRTRAPVVVGRDRVAAARALLERHQKVDVVVSDDGLQHHRLPRDVAVVVFDERGAGNGLLLPAGPLRSPLPARLPPDTLVLYNAPQPTTALPGSTAQRRLAGVVPLRDWWQGAPPAPASLDALRGRPLVAVAGVAAPERFFAMLEAEGLGVVRVPQPDHAHYDRLPWPAHATDVVVTEKDAVKLEPDRVGATRVWVATLDFYLDPALEATLDARLQPLRKAPR